MTIRRKVIALQESSEALTESFNGGQYRDLHGVDRGFRQREDRFLRADIGRPNHRDMLAGVLHHHWRRAFVLAREWRIGREEFTAVALDTAAGRGIDVDRRLSNRRGSETPIFLLGDG